jgi:hypothetical protein
MQQVVTWFPKGWIDEIDAIVEARYGATNRSAVIRELVGASLQARRKSSK